MRRPLTPFFFAGAPTGPSALGLPGQRSARRAANARMPSSQSFTLIELLVALGILAFVLTLALPRIGRLPARLRAERGVSAVRTAFSEAALTARATGRAVRLVLIVEDDASRFVMKRGINDTVTEDILGHFTLPQPDESGLFVSREDVAGAQAGGFLPEERDVELPEDLTWGSKYEGELEVYPGDEIAFIFHPGGEAGGPELPFMVGKRSYVLGVERLTGRAVITEVAD